MKSRCVLQRNGFNAVNARVVVVLVFLKLTSSKDADFSSASQHVVDNIVHWH